MKIYSHYIYLLLASGLTSFATSCGDDWDEHYEAQSSGSNPYVEVYAGTTEAYLASQSDLSRYAQSFRDAGLSSLLGSDNCTAIVCSNGAIPSDSETLLSSAQFARNLVSDQIVSPGLLVPGYGLSVLSGKCLWVSESDEDATSGKLGVCLNGCPVTRVVKTSNGYVYQVDGVIPVQQSVYEYIKGLGDDYSMFRSFVEEFEVSYFDAEASVPSGVDKMGNTIYSDSVISTRNTLMDRYSVEGIAQWDMRSESYYSTLFVPNNDVLSAAYKGALDSLSHWCNRPSFASDSLRFRKWIVESCFVDRKLEPSDVKRPDSWHSMADNRAVQFNCVGGYVREINELLDKETFVEEDAAIWNPAIQVVDADHPVQLSNGVAYRLTKYKVPNHIVIWRLKTRLFQIWSALQGTHKELLGLNDEEDAYFKFNNLHFIGMSTINSAGESYDASMPSMDYTALLAYPDSVAVANAYPVSLEMVGTVRNPNDLVSTSFPHDGSTNYETTTCYIPAGEYYLRMGGTHRVNYSFSVYFGAEDEELNESKRVVHNLSIVSTGANMLGDRGGAMPGVEFTGEQSVGYPMDYDPYFWYNQSSTAYEKAFAYNTDGQHIATVTMPHAGNFRLKVESEDIPVLWPLGTQSTTAITNYTFCLYHWTLRPTSNNY